ncbi:MAG: thiol peroxidase [Brevinema sp.]
MNITFKGNPVTLIGKQWQKGDQAPDFKSVTLNLEPWSLSDVKGIKLISVVPSLDTGTCQTQTAKFNTKMGEHKEINMITISLDLPFAQQRWCGANDINMTVLSDYQNREFAEKFGLLIDELKLLARAVFILDEKNTIQYVEYVSEVSHEPNYDAAIDALKSLL